jgi:trehalose-phosphatase
MKKKTPACFFDSLSELRGSLEGARVYLLLDYDGTLAPISPTPETAVLPAAAKAALERLALDERRRVAVVSGRSLQDVRAMTGIDGIAYVGNHGREIMLPCGRPDDGLEAARESAPDDLKRALRESLVGFRGVRFEDKGISFAVHYRLVEDAQAPELLREFDKIVRDYGHIEVRTGKMVREVRPRGPWNKGTAVRRLLDLERADYEGPMIPLYIGDDETDEDAFRELAGEGITVRVGGPDETHAAYRMNDIDEVTKFLEILCKH